MSLFLDTDVVIAYFRGNKKVAELIEDRIAKQEIIYTNPIVVAGIYAGLRKSEEPLTKAFFDSIEIAMIDRLIAEKAGEYLRLFLKSHGIDFPDALIAAHTFYLDVPLFTFNKKHYPMKDIRLFR